MIVYLHITNHPTNKDNYLSLCCLPINNSIPFLFKLKDTEFIIPRLMKNPRKYYGVNIKDYL